MDRLEDTLSAIIDSEVLWFPMQGTVHSFDASGQTVSVRTDAQIDGADTVIESVPLIFPGGGEWGMSFHAAAGDKVLLVFCSREVYLWLSGQDAQSEFIRPGLRTAVAFPVIPRGSVRPTAGTAAGITLRKRDNSVSLVLSDTGIAVMGDMDVTGNISASGNISANGLVTAAALTPSTAVSLSTHTHLTNGAPPTPGT